MTNITQKLPHELLVEILGHLPVPDVLRVKQVNRTFQDSILASPIQHKIDLYAAGLEYNPGTRLPLADSREALRRYLAAISLLSLVEPKIVDDAPLMGRCFTTTVGGIYAIFEDPIRFYNPGSASRGVPYKKWEIKAPFDPRPHQPRRCFYPGADIVAFIETQEVPDYLRIRIHLRSLSDGGHHPAAIHPIIERTQRCVIPQSIFLTLITTSRLVMVSGKERGGEHFVVWDWRSGQILFEFEEPYCYTMEFIDDFRLLVGLIGGSRRDRPFIVLMDTEKHERGAPTRTVFHLPPRSPSFIYSPFISERGMYTPSSMEPLAPFHQDPTQRIIAWEIGTDVPLLVFRVGALLEYHEKYEGSEVPWDEWGCRAVSTPLGIRKSKPIRIWVSGCRLYSAHPTSNPRGCAKVDVYDFSVGGRAKYLGGQVDEIGFEVIRYLSSTGEKTQFPSVECSFTDFTQGAIFSLCRIRDSDGPYALHIWTS